MGSKAFTFLIFVHLLLATSCTYSTFYQIYRVSADSNISKSENYLYYEDENCRITYNLWDEGGDVGFAFHNKTEKNIIIDLDRTFFVLNDVAYKYYRNRTFTISNRIGRTNSSATSNIKIDNRNNYGNLAQNIAGRIANEGLSLSSEITISYFEDRFIYIPPKTHKKVSEYKATSSIYRDCQLLRYPSNKNIKSKLFSKDDSPLVFKNIISYKIEDSEKNIILTNGFYVIEITNYPEDAAVESKYVSFCGQTPALIQNYKQPAPNKFYLKYYRGADRSRY